MEKYLDHSAGYLEELLAACSDFKERQHIRGALRELKGLKLEGGSVITYSFGSDSIKRAQSLPYKKEQNSDNSQHRKGDLCKEYNDEPNKEKPPWRKSKLRNGKNSPRSSDNTINEENSRDNKSTSNNNIHNYRSYLYAGKINSPVSEGTEDKLSVNQRNPGNESRERERNRVRRPVSASPKYPQGESDQLSPHQESNRKFVQRPVSLRLSGGSDRINTDTSPRTHPPLPPRKPRRISYRTSPFSSTSTSPFSPPSQQSPRNTKISLTSPRLEGVRSRSAQGNISGSHSMNSPRKCNRFFADMKADNVRSNISENVKVMDDDSVFDSKSNVTESDKNVDSVSGNKLINAMNSDIYASQMSPQNGNQNKEEVGKENIILSRTERDDEEISEGKTTPRKKSSLMRKNRVNSDSYKELRLANQKVKEDGLISPKVSKSESVHSKIRNELTVKANTTEAVDINRETSENVQIARNSARDIKTRTPRRKLPQLPAKNEEEDDETVHARTIRLLQERKKDRIKKQQQVPVTPEKPKMTQEEVKKKLEQKLERSDSKRKAARVRRELQLLNREKEAKSPRPCNGVELSVSNIVSAREREPRRKLVQRSKSDIVKSKPASVAVKEITVQGVTDDNVEFKSDLVDQIEANCAKGPLSPVSKIEIIGSLMQEEARLQEMLRKSSNFSEKRKMRAEVRRLREKRVELENFTNKSPAVTVKRCASVTAGLITPASIPDNSRIDMPSRPSINDLRRQLSETTDYDEKKKIRLALRHLRQQTRDGTVNQTGVQRSQSFAHATSSQPVCNGDTPLNRPLVSRSQSVTETFTNSHESFEPLTRIKHDAGQLSCDISVKDKEVAKPEPVIQTERKAQFRKPTLYKTATENRQSLRERESLQLGRVSAPILSQGFKSTNEGTKALKETHTSNVEIKPPVPESISQTKSSFVPASLSRKHSLDSVNNKQNSEQDGKNKLFERRKLFENGVDKTNDKTEPKSKPRTTNILISRGNLSNTKSTNENTPTKPVEHNTLKTELLKASDRKTAELTTKRNFLDKDNVKETERKLSPSLLWLEDKRKSLPTLKDLDKLMSTMDIEAAFSQILDDVDTEPLAGDAVDAPVIGIKTTTDIPIVEEELSESSVNEELEALENSRNAEKNKSAVTASVQDKNEISEDIMMEMNGEREDIDSNGETKMEECNNNNKSAIQNPGIKKSEATIQLRSNLSLELSTQPEPNSAISVIHGEDGTVTVQEVNKAQEGDTTITEWKKIRRTQSRTETRETDTIREKTSTSPGGGSTVYEKDVSKTKKKLTSRGSEYFSRNNYNIKRVKDPEGSETVLHELSSENKNLSVTKNESWGDKSEAQIVLTKDEGDLNGVEAKQSPIIQEDETKKSKPKKSIVRTTSVCQIRLSNNTAVVDQDSKLEAQLGRPSGCPHITSTLTEVSVIEGSTARLECVVKATPPATMTWFRGDIQLLEREDTQFGLDRATGKAWLEVNPVRMGHVGEYKCVFENEKGSASSTGKLSVTAKPGNPPSFLTTLEDISVRESQPVTLQCSVMDTDSVAWYKDGVIQPNNPDFKQTFDGQTVTMEISELFLDDSGTYTCVLRSKQGEKKTSCNIEVTESESSHEVFPAFLKKPETQIADELDTVIIECDIIGSPAPDITWLQERTAIIQNEQNSFSYDGRVARLVMKRVTLKDNGKIECVAANSCGKVSADCMLVVKATKKEPKFTRMLEDMTVEFGKVAIFECGIVGTTADNISWHKNECIIGQTFDFKQIYKDDIARLEIQNVCQADAGFYECTATTDDGSISISSGCDLTIKDKTESQPSEPQPSEPQPSEPQLSVQEEKAQTATVKKFPTRFVPKVDKDQIKTSKSQASKVMLVRQGSWRIPGSEKTERPLKRTGSWQSLSSKEEKIDTPEKGKIEREPVSTNIGKELGAKSSTEPISTAPVTAVTASDDKLLDYSKQVFSVDHSKPEQKNELDHNKNNIAGVNANAKETQSKFISSKHDLFDNKAAVKVDNERTPLCSKEDSDIKPKMKFKIGGEIRRTQSTRAPGNEKPEWLQVKLRSVGANKSPLSTKEKEAIEKSYGRSESQGQEKVEKVVQESQIKLSRSQSARVVDRTNNPALRDSTNSPSNDPNKSAPKITPVSERAKIFQMKDSNSGKSSPTDIIAKALNLCRAESMRSPVGRSSVNVQRSHSFKTSGQTGTGGVTLDLSPQQSKGQQEKGDLGSSPKVIKYWDPTTPKTSKMADVSSINDEEELIKMLSATEDFDQRKKIRARMKEVRDEHAKEWEARKQARAHLVEDEIKKKHRQADLDKQRKLDAFKEQAKEKHEAKHLDMAEQHLRERMRSADEAKQRQLDNFDKMARKEDLSQTSKVTTDVSKDGKTTTTTRRTETVTKVGGAKPAEELAPVMLQQIINATSPHVSGGSLKVKTESWSSKDGVTNTSEKAESWGGRGGARNMFKSMDAKTNPGGGAGRGGPIMRSPSAIKTMLLEWCKAMTREYVDKIEITNFSTCWNNGIAFCALIHHFYPDSFDFEALDPKQRRKNFELAFDTAEKLADIAPLLDVEDMVRMQKPDWKCVFTYVQSFYRKLQNHERNKAMKSES